jgi:hypothetical protein
MENEFPRTVDKGNAMLKARVASASHCHKTLIYLKRKELQAFVIFIYIFLE